MRIGANPLPAAHSHAAHVIVHPNTTPPTQKCIKKAGNPVVSGSPALRDAHGDYAPIAPGEDPHRMHIIMDAKTLWFDLFDIAANPPFFSE